MEHGGDFSDILFYEDFNPGSDRFRSFTTNNVAVRVTGQPLEKVSKHFISGLGPTAGDVKVVAVHSATTFGFTRKARFEAFNVFARTMAQKCGGDPNIKNAWYGGNRAEISGIMANGFGLNMNKTNSIQMVPHQFVLDAAKNSAVDEYGVRHILMCRVIMGKSELVPLGSNQVWPSSSAFDSGVDSVSNPRRYFVWTCHMNTHIHPVYVVSFKASGVHSPYGFPIFIASLARFLPRSKIDILTREANRISKVEVYRRVLVEQEVDDKVLDSAIKLLFAPSRSDDGISLSDVMLLLEKSLSAPIMALVTKSYIDFRGKKISKAQMMETLHYLAGDKLKEAVMELDTKPHL